MVLLLKNVLVVISMHMNTTKVSITNPSAFRLAGVTLLSSLVIVSVSKLFMAKENSILFLVVIWYHGASFWHNNL